QCRTKRDRRDRPVAAAAPAPDSRRHRGAESRRHEVKAFEYANPTNEKDAVAALRVDGRIALPLAGGMDLVARMKDYVTSPARVVYLKTARDKTTVAAPGGGLKIGAGVKIVDLAENSQVAK